MLHKYSIKAGIIRILDFRLNFFVSSVEKTQEIFPAGCFTELKYPPGAGSLLARLFFSSFFLQSQSGLVLVFVFLPR